MTLRIQDFTEDATNDERNINECSKRTKAFSSK